MMDEETFINDYLSTRGNFKTVSGKRVKILFPGYRNAPGRAGPDFLCAEVKISSRIVRGDIEFDIGEEFWLGHKHNRNPLYNNTILHFILISRPGITKHKKTETVLFSPVNKNINKKISDYYTRRPCVKKIFENPQYLLGILGKLGKTRLRNKTRRIQSLIRKKMSHNQIIYRKICESSGYPDDQKRFRYLTDKIPWKTVRRLNEKQLEKSILQTLKECESIYPEPQKRPYHQTRYRAGMIIGWIKDVEKYKNSIKWLKSLLKNRNISSYKDFELIRLENIYIPLWTAFSKYLNKEEKKIVSMMPHRKFRHIENRISIRLLKQYPGVIKNPRSIYINQGLISFYKKHCGNYRTTCRDCVIPC